MQITIRKKHVSISIALAAAIVYGVEATQMMADSDCCLLVVA
jgi:hypothetical protein